MAQRSLSAAPHTRLLPRPPPPDLRHTLRMHPEPPARELLHQLATGNAVSGEALATHLGVTRAAVWKQIAALRAMGLPIEARSRAGYRMPWPLQLLHIPDTAWRLALQLGLPALTRWRLVEWPMVRGRLLVLGGFVFVLCFNSFAVVLALGGGPQATTLELAVYQALKYDFNLPEALTLAWVQFAIAGTLFVLLGRLGGSSWLVLEQGGDRVPVPGRWKRLRWW